MPLKIKMKTPSNGSNTAPAQMLSGVVLHSAHILTVQLPRDTVGEAIQWLCDNAGKFAIHDHTSDAYHTDCEVLSRMTIEFESHSDAAKFKLMWANGS